MTVPRNALSGYPNPLNNILAPPPPTVKARGFSGRLHEFQVFAAGTRFIDVPGLYVITKLGSDGLSRQAGRCVERGD